MKEVRVSDDKQPDPLAVLAATLEGDRWLSAESAAFLLGQLKMSTFYQIAAAPDFPKAARIGKGRKWRRLELLEYPKLAAWVGSCPHWAGRAVGGCLGMA